MNENGDISLLNEEDSEKYQGEYVTVSSSDSKKVICHNENAVKVYEETQRMGYKDPIIIYIPVDGEDFVYSVRDSQLLDAYA